MILESKTETLGSKNSTKDLSIGMKTVLLNSGEASQLESSDITTELNMALHGTVFPGDE